MVRWAPFSADFARCLPSVQHDIPAKVRTDPFGGTRGRLSRIDPFPRSGLFSQLLMRLILSWLATARLSVRSFLLIICSGFLVSAFLHADELVLRTRPKPGQLLVLHSGRVFKGVMTPRAGGYDIVQPGGRVFIASEQIHFLADDIDDAWRKLRASQQELTPDTHLELARWCLNQKQYGKAKREILDALHLDPYRADAKRMLEALTRMEQQAGQPRLSDAERVAQRLREVREHGALAPQRRSLGGLPQDLAKKYTRTIQPILSNKCSNARCHGQGQNDFVVLSIQRGVTPTLSERNLAALIGQMDFENPMESPVLKATYGLHGGSRQLLFAGKSGGRLRQSLQDWIVSAAREMDPGLAVGLADSDLGKPAIRTVSAELETDAMNQTSQTVADQAMGSRYRDEQASRFLHEATVATRHDAFDPDEFNRMVHGRSRADRSPALSDGSPVVPVEPQTYLNQTFSVETSGKDSP